MTSFDVIIPARNEMVKLAQTAPALKIALTGLPAEVIYILNATTDGSEEIIRSVFGERARIIVLAGGGKSGALRAGDNEAENNIRVYLDADVIVAPSIFRTLLLPLIEGTADLVAPRLSVDLSQSSGLSLRVGRVWADQLNRRENAFMCCTAFSEAGIQKRGKWPDVLADDDWARNRIDPTRRKIIETAQARVSAPRNLKSWLIVRARWIRGTKELRILTQRNAPKHRTRPKGVWGDLLAYYLVRLMAEPLAFVQKYNQLDWGRDNSTRTNVDK